MKKEFLVFFVLTTSLYSNSLDTVLHPIETAKKAAIGAGIAFATKKVGEAAYNDFQIYMQERPSDAEEYLKRKIQFADGFFKYIDKHQSGINPREFDKIDKTIRDEVIQIDKAVEIQRRKNNDKCNTIHLSILLNSSPDLFDQKFNPILPSFYSSDTKQLSQGDSDSYKALFSKKNTLLQRDHIPSYASIILFYKNKGYSFDKKVEDNLKQNTSAIAINTEIHRKTQTYGGRNTKIRQDVDANNLRLASIRNMVFEAALVYKDYDASAFSTYVAGAITLYKRNSILCLYQ